MFNAETQRREVRREVLSWGCTPLLGHLLSRLASLGGYPDPLGEADCKKLCVLCDSATLR